MGQYAALSIPLERRFKTLKGAVKNKKDVFSAMEVFIFYSHFFVSELVFHFR